MDRIWQWAWDRFGARYTWAGGVVAFLISLPIYLTFVSFPIIAFENSDRYVDAAAVTVGAVVVLACVMVLPDRRWARLAERWAAGEEVDRAAALEGTYIFVRRATSRTMWAAGVWAAALAVAVGAIAGAGWTRLAQYGVLAAVIAVAVQLVALHNSVEAAWWPARVALAGDTGIGDCMPRSRPTFATRSNVSMVAVAFAYALGGALLAAVSNRVSAAPILSVVIGAALAVVFAVPVTVGFGFSRSMQPIRDLAKGAERVAAGDFSRRLPVVQDDDLGALSASFNRMQAGLAERQRLQGAFGTYVDPTLAARLLEQGDDVFTGERREVTVMFVDIRDFTPFAEANSAEDTVARLNALFDIVVPAVVNAGGHVNKFLGDGALAVFGAPNDVAGHADSAVSAAMLIHHLVTERFGGALRIGIGINTGVVIAGTIGGAGKLEFTLIGDAVNVAARVEQLTKATGDTILLTESCVDALASRPPGLLDRGSHALKGKSATVQVFTLGAAQANYPPRWP
ncbi:adenylate/guanylate cyclase domain-containing protein [Mycobacterium alsense]|uniref:Adenylate/guanylate cyclase domain-containing protein n=1 Tax=Mycobacterium alsense TaxID=324058 RepID=A0AA41XQ06_9MYCO|nr:adenylate/guanylate cyclase domain-containing protein [Mycobacterium alsense]MCV7379337.1 adenylate/guanylate cyclase domain-containing protein [Mycobacterium alsense]OQZ92355.1 adenylate/guanylate cyclase domain-containing protein [Mycobacterium alsense]